MATIVKKHEYKTVKVSQLVEFENNPNVHSQTQIEALAESIKRYGQYFEIVTDENFMILNGHGKKKALELLGEENARVCVLYGLTHKQKLKIIAEDNKIQSLSTINYNVLEDILREVGDTDIIGFSTEYLDAIVNDVALDNTGVDFMAPEPKAPKPTYTPEKEEAQVTEMAEVEQGMQKARTIVCPHCGKEITL